MQEKDGIRDQVRKRYGGIAKAGGVSGCGSSSSSSCSSGCCAAPGAAAAALSWQLGYSGEELAGVPEGANMGLGCGNPQAIAALRAGETVLDLGSGGGLDCFLAAWVVGEGGRVIGVDMTPEMIGKARHNAARADFTNVEFRLGELENLPVADEIIDVILSNCVINLSPDKARVFGEAFRVLKPGGRLAIADVVRTVELPEEIRFDLALYTGCIAGASSIPELESMLTRAGFVDIRICPKDASREFIREWVPGTNAAEYVLSATIEAVKPGT